MTNDKIIQTLRDQLEQVSKAKEAKIADLRNKLRVSTARVIQLETAITKLSDLVNLALPDDEFSDHPTKEEMELVAREMIRVWAAVFTQPVTAPA